MTVVDWAVRDIKMLFVIDIPRFTPAGRDVESKFILGGERAKPFKRTFP